MRSIDGGGDRAFFCECVASIFVFAMGLATRNCDANESSPSALRYRCEESLLIGLILIVLFVVVLPIVLVRVYLKRQKVQQAAHDARLRAMTQTFLAAARKKKAAEAAAASGASTAFGSGASGDGASSAAPITSAPAGTRDERECPYCAELILKKARVCKHCRRDVEPVAG